MVVCFMLINYTFVCAVKFAISKSGFSEIGDDVKQAAKYVAMAAAA